MSRITIRVPDPETKYSLEYPEFFMACTKATLRKILGWCCKYDHLNGEALETFDRELPFLEEDIARQDLDTIEHLRELWAYQEQYFKKVFKNPDPSTFPADWTKEQKKQERAERKRWNSLQMREVNEAKKAYEAAQKKAPKRLERVREILEIYRAAKEEYRVGV